jgi:hypothetical protein
MLAKSFPLCLFSIAIPFVGHSANFWLFSGSQESSEDTQNSPVVAAAEEVALASKKPAPSACKGKKNWDCIFSLGMGYRHDRLSQRYTPNTSALPRVKFRYRHVDSVMEIFRFDGRWSNFLFNFEGDYSPVVSGMQYAPYNTNPALSSDFRFKFKKLTGYEADAMASVGYRLLFMNGHTSRAAIILQVGYRYSHQSYEAEAQDKTRQPSYVSIMQDQAPSHTEWFGPFLEGRFSFSYRDYFYVQPFYQYHFLDYRAERKEAQMTFSYVNGIPPITNDFITSFRTEGESARGQVAGLDVFYQPKSRLRLGLKGTYLLFESRETNTKTRQKQTNYNTNPPVTTRNKIKYHSHADWRSYTIEAYAGYHY